MRQIIAILPETRANGQGSRDGTALACSLPPHVLPHLRSLLKTQFKRYRKKLRRCQKRFSEKAVHDSRVESRRVLALMKLLDGLLPKGRVKKIEAALKRYLDTFDDLRDTQVQLPAVAKLARGFPAARVFEEYLLKREKRLARKTRRAINRIKTRRLSKWLSASRQELAAACKRCTPEAAAVPPLRSVTRAFARTCQLRARINPRDPRTIHRTRVAFKKFRYMVETLAAYLPAATRQYLEALHEYQTLMGDIQDAEVLLRSFEAYQLEHPGQLEAARRFRQELLHRRETRTRVFLKSSSQLLDFWPPGQSAQHRPAHRRPARSSDPSAGGLPRQRQEVLHP